MARIKDPYKNEKIGTMQCISGKENLSYALTKRNIDVFKILNEVLISEMLSYDVLSVARRLTFTDQTPQ